MMSGRSAARSTAAARSSSLRSARGRMGACTRSSKNSSGKSYAIAATSCGRPRNAGPHSPGSRMTLIAWGSALSTCAGSVMRSQKRTTGRKESLTVIDGVPKCSTCWRTGSGSREWKVSPAMKSTGRRLAMAMPAAVTILVAPGPTDDVATMICWRRLALLNAAAARPMPCSFWPRQTGSASRCISRECPRLVTLPWPKIAKTPGKRGASSASRPGTVSTSTRCAMR